MVVGQVIRKIAAANVIDVDTGAIAVDQDIWLDHGRIQAVRPASSGVSGHDLDARGGFAIPGLIDTHVHALGPLIDTVPGVVDLPWVLRQQRRNLAAFVRAGVTTVRDMAAPLKVVQRLARLAAAGRSLSPRIVFAGPIFSVPGGYPYFVPPLPKLLEWIVGPVRVDVTSAAHARRAVEELARAQVSCIKIAHQAARYDDGRSPLPCLSPDLLRAIVARAHDHGLPAAVHNVYVDELAELLEIPFDSFEHLPIDGVLPDEAIAQLARTQTPISTTLMTYGIIDHLDRMERLLAEPGELFEAKPLAFLKKAVRGLRAGQAISEHIGRDVMLTGSRFMRQNLQKLHTAGARICFGTDSGGAITPPGNPMWELLDMTRSGLSNQAALQTATTTAAAVLGRNDLGRLQPGCAADVVILAGNPLETIEAVADVAAVVCAGRLANLGSA